MALAAEIYKSSSKAAFCRKVFNKGALLRCLRHISTADSDQNDGQSSLATGADGLPSSRLKFDDHREVFSHKTSWELLRGLLVLRICGMDIIADNALKLFRMGHKLFGEKTLGWFLRPTIYAQFVAAGKKGSHSKNPSTKRTGPQYVSKAAEEGLEIAAESLKTLGLRLMVAPTLEGDVGEGGKDDLYERNLQELLHLSELAWNLGGGDDRRYPCLQVKATALMAADDLKKLAKVFHEASALQRIKLVEFLAQTAINTTVEPKDWSGIPGLDEETSDAILKGSRRLGHLGDSAKRKGLRLLVDAEWSYINEAVSLLALALMAVFNRERPMVCNTIQCYFKDAKNNLERELQMSKSLGTCYGAKIVRGAYLEQERSLVSNGGQVLTCSSHMETGRNYNRVITHFMEFAASMEPGRCMVIVATHNEDGVRHAVDTIHSLNVSPQDGRIAFAQIYGMAEQISMPLVRRDYIVYKSVPVGELSQVLPYLARRAAENRAVLLGARKERELLQKELLWRIRR